VWPAVQDLVRQSGGGDASSALRPPACQRSRGASRSFRRRT
jgi:hypothetical protein